MCKSEEEYEKEKGCKFLRSFQACMNFEIGAFFSRRYYQAYHDDCNEAEMKENDFCFANVQYLDLSTKGSPN